jgi:hypothetical protein
MLAVYAAAHTYAPQLRNQSVLFLVDNSTDVAIINRQATRSARLSSLLRSLYDLALRYNFSIRARHRRGVDNGLADFLSRPQLHKNDHLREWGSLLHTQATKQSLTSEPLSSSSCSVPVLRSVCLVHSRQFVDSNSVGLYTSSVRSPSDATPATPTARRTTTSSSSVAQPVLTRFNRSPRSNSVLPLSTTQHHTKSQMYRSTFPHSPTGQLHTASVPYLVTPSSTVFEPDSTTTMVNSTSPNQEQHSRSATYVPSAPSSTSHNSKISETGVRISSPSSVSFDYTSSLENHFRTAA